MGWGSRATTPSVALGALVVILGSGSAAVAAGTAPPDAREVMLTDVGPDWAVTDEQTGSLGAFTRTWRGPLGELSINGFPVTDPPGVGPLFEGFATDGTGFEVIPAEALDLGVWLVPDGGTPGDSGLTALTFASNAHIFSITLAVAEGAELDGPTLALELADRQIDAAGGPPVIDAEPAPRDLDDSELLSLLPERPPPGYGLAPGSLSLAGADELAIDESVVPEVVEFVNDRTRNVARAWAGEELLVGIGITEYPYEIFAAAALGEYDAGGAFRIGATHSAQLRDAVTFRNPENGALGVAFRRDAIQVVVLVQALSPAAEDAAAALALDAAASVAERLPGGSTAPYRFPDPPSRIAGLALTALVVVAAVGGSRGVAAVRAHRVRRRWATVGVASPVAAPGAAPGGAELIDLDGDAAALRRRGRWVAGVQLLTVVVGVLALAGDFGTPGMVVAATSLIVGLGFSRWWIRHEVGLLGATAPPRALTRPRPFGALLGLVTFAVLGVGVSFFLKGVRYLIFDPTLAQLQWSDRLGLSPRGVGVAFTLGGLGVAFLGAALYRLARALSRAGARRVLADDPRPPALYLRSFADDSLPLPTISSARRPMFELFSLRGADPFEESVAWELNSYAPVVAIGRPGASLRSLGAAREHLEQESWRTEIADRMVDARLIVLAPGETDGLAWELGAIVSGGHLPKTLFVFPPLSPVDLARRWNHTVGVLRDAGAPIAAPAIPLDRVHTVRIDPSGALRATVASTRDEATYRTAVDHSVEQEAPAPAPVAWPAPAGAT